MQPMQQQRKAVLLGRMGDPSFIFEKVGRGGSVCRSSFDRTLVRCSVREVLKNQGGMAASRSFHSLGLWTSALFECQEEKETEEKASPCLGTIYLVVLSREAKTIGIVSAVTLNLNLGSSGAGYLRTAHSQQQESTLFKHKRRNKREKIDKTQV